MELSALETIVVGGISILIMLLVALGAEWYRARHADLRERYVELKTRQEEGAKHRPVEAVEWLQHLLGARQGPVVRFRGMRPQARPEQGAPVAASKRPEPKSEAAARPAAARPAASPAAASPKEASPAASILKPRVESAPAPIAALSPKIAPAATPVPAAQVAAPSSAPAHANSPDPVRQRSSRLAEARARREANGTPDPPSLLDSLPKPRWLRKEQEARAAAKEVHDVVPAIVAEQPAPAAEEASAEPRKTETFWTYRGLLDKVVAVTSQRQSILSPMAAAAETAVDPVAETPVVEKAAQLVVVESAGPAQIQTVSVEVPNSPMTDHAEPHSELSTLTDDGRRVIALPGVSETPAEPVLDQIQPLVTEPAVEIAAQTAAEIAAQTIVTPALDPGAVPAVMVVEETNPDPEAVEASAPMPAVRLLELPAGFHDRSVLDPLLQSTDPVCGVVVAIGINDLSHHREKMGAKALADWTASVEAMIRTLVTGQEFGCRSSEDEFVLVYANETGAAAQRRLNTISEKLWGFQLRSLGAFSVMFSWGAVEIQGETLADAVASASERMYQTKRNRKAVPMDSTRNRRAVNL